MFKKISICGLGLLGGSLSQALKKMDSSIQIKAYGRQPEKLKKALENQWVDKIDSIDNLTFEGVDLFVIATPVISSIDIIKKILENPNLEEKTLVIDVGSVKEAILEGVKSHPKAKQFIGCHPMAGSEKTGYEHSSQDLYQQATVIITPQETNKIEDLDKIKNFWEKLNSKVYLTSATEHDRLVSLTSHLPHLVSSLLVKTLEKIDFEKELDPFIGSGFRDMTRLATGSAQMWSEIVLLNKENISTSLNKMIAELEKLKEIVDQEKLNSNQLIFFFEKAKNWRESLNEKNNYCH